MGCPTAATLQHRAARGRERAFLLDLRVPGRVAKRATIALRPLPRGLPERDTSTSCPTSLQGDSASVRRASGLQAVCRPDTSRGASTDDRDRDRPRTVSPVADHQLLSPEDTRFDPRSTRTPTADLQVPGERRPTARPLHNQVSQTSLTSPLLRHAARVRRHAHQRRERLPAGARKDLGDESSRADQGLTVLRPVATWSVLRAFRDQAVLITDAASPARALRRRGPRAVRLHHEVHHVRRCTSSCHPSTGSRRYFGPHAIVGRTVIFTASTPAQRWWYPQRQGGVWRCLRPPAPTPAPRILSPGYQEVNAPISAALTLHAPAVWPRPRQPAAVASRPVPPPSACSPSPRLTVATAGRRRRTTGTAR